MNNNLLLTHTLLYIALYIITYNIWNLSIFLELLVNLTIDSQQTNDIIC